jgi:hypothetical protein
MAPLAMTVKPTSNWHEFNALLGFTILALGRITVAAGRAERPVAAD